jgi:HlyD family secretion protein
VRNRQELIKLPDVSAMKVNVKIHESYVNQIRPGQQAFVVLDSMPDRRFAAVVDSVSLLPDTQSRWANPNLKVYGTQVRIVDKLPDVKPGVSARAEIIITNIPDALTIPIQAVTTRGGKQVVYLDDSPTEPVPVTVGMYNTKMIQVVSGLNDGARVLLAPPTDMMQKDLGGAILAEGEEIPVQTNVPPMVPISDSPPGLPEGFANPADAGMRPGGEGFPSGDVTGRPGPRGGGAGFDREAMMKQFDKDGDGQLNDEERAAMRQQFGGGRRSRTNAPPAQP